MSNPNCLHCRLLAAVETFKVDALKQDPNFTIDHTQVLVSLSAAMADTIEKIPQRARMKAMTEPMTTILGAIVGDEVTAGVISFGPDEPGPGGLH